LSADVEHTTSDEEDRGQLEHRQFLEDNHARVSGIARDGYLTHGRGAIFVFEDAILDALDGTVPSVTIEYVPDDSPPLARRGGWPTEGHAELVRSYDPTTSMLVFVGRRRGGRELFAYRMRFAPDEPEPELVQLRRLVE
jgi:hypothetical protein